MSEDFLCDEVITDHTWMLLTIIMKMSSTQFLYSGIVSAADGVATEALCPGPPVWGGPQTVLNSFSSLSSFFKRGPFRCIVDFKSACFYCFALTLMTQLQKCWCDYTAQPQTRDPYIDLKPLNEDGNCQVCMYGMHAQKVASEAPRTHVKSQNFLGVCPQTLLTQSIVWAPLFVFALGPHNAVGGPGHSIWFCMLLPCILCFYNSCWWDNINNIINVHIYRVFMLAHLLTAWHCAKLVLWAV